ncbi:MAG: hypothetical protein HKN19_09110 [Halioglobus sp.]|nr:hypothetical protein [Halioglobus sp.]
MVKKFAISLSAATLIGLSTAASALPVASNGSNNNLASAQSVNAFFDLSANAQIENSTLIPHVEITNTGGDNTFDYFWFSVSANGTDAVFDVDCGSQTAGSPNTGCSDQDDPFDPFLDLLTPGGASLDFDDDDFTGDPGSENNNLDSLLRTTLDSGDYVIRVSDWPGQEIPDGATYVLNVSIGNLPSTVPAPGVVLLFGLGLLALGANRSQTR